MLYLLARFAREHLPEPDLHLFHNELIRRSALRRDMYPQLTLVAWMNILTSSSILLGDCFRACLSSNAKQWGRY